MKLNGARFTFEDITPKDHAYYAYHDLTKPFFNSQGQWQSGEAFLETNDKGIVEQAITGLIPGVYKLKEVKAPEGYVSVDSNSGYYWNVVVAEDGTISLGAGSNEADKIVINGTANIVGVQNAPQTYKLPSTGGMGTGVFAIAGGLLMLVAGALYVRRTGRSQA